MPKEDYYSIVTHLSREFLQSTHSHQLLREFSFDDEAESVEFYKGMASGLPEMLEWHFGGFMGRQFSSQAQTKSFFKSYNDLLKRNNITDEHKYNLLYFISFYSRGYSEQLDNIATHNSLIESARFLIDLIHNSNISRQELKRKGYIEVTHCTDSSLKDFKDETKKYPFGKTYFYVKKELYEKHKENLQYLENYKPKRGDRSVIFYHIVPFYKNRLHIPYDVWITIKGRKAFKSYGQNEQIDLHPPNSIQNHLFSYIVSFILKDHEEHKTSFYKAFNQSNIGFNEMAVQYEKQMKHHISERYNMGRVGKLIEDYLMKNKLFPSKRQASLFIFEYFCLMKALPITKQQLKERPKDYSKLVSFYKSIDYDSENIRSAIKEIEA